MQKKQVSIVLLSVIILVSVVTLGIGVSQTFLKKNIKEEKGSLERQSELAYENNKEINIKKTETKEYYYFEIEDYERDLSYSWKFHKNNNQNVSVEDSLYIEEDLRLSLDAVSQNTNAINNLVEQKKLIITFDYHGNLPLETTVKINVADRFKNGEHLYLYYYNPEEDIIEYIDHNKVVKDGYVEFQIEHCSDYFLTAAIVNDAVNNPQSVNYVIIGLVVVVFILIAVTLFQSKK